MSKLIGTLRRVSGIGLAWAILWGAFWAVVAVVIRIVDPGSIDPGEGAMMVAILGPMGLFSGVAFGALLSIGERGRTSIDHSLIRVTAWGILGSAIVQLAYLDHGDQGLAADGPALLCYRRRRYGGVARDGADVVAPAPVTPGIFLTSPGGPSHRHSTLGHRG